MKKIITAIIVLFLFSCKKELTTISYTDPYLHSVIEHLKDSLSSKDFSLLDTGKAYLTQSENMKYHTLRMGLIGKPIGGDFMLLRTDAGGNILQGRVIHLENGGIKKESFSGKIQIRSLYGTLVLQSSIQEGVITALHQGIRTGTPIKEVDSKTVTLLPAPGTEWLPEVVVIGYGSGSASTSYIALDGLFGPSSSDILAGGGGDDAGGGGGNSGGGGGTGGNDGGSTNGGNGDGDSGSTTGGSGGDSTNQPSQVYSPVDPETPSKSNFLGRPTVSGGILIEQEYINSIPVIDIKKFFNCFDQIPNAGASYSVKLCVDVPINGNPAASINMFSAFSAGHTFLIITKSGSNNSVTQSFGFYPGTSLSLRNPYSPVPSTIKDNGGQEINGSISMEISGDQFNTLKANAINLSARAYTLDSSNCTDYALLAFNSARTNPITLDPYIVRVPGMSFSGIPAAPGYTVTINNSPQRLFEKLRSIQAANGPEASNVKVDLSHNYKAAISHGQCD